MESIWGVVIIAGPLLLAGALVYALVLKRRRGQPPSHIPDRKPPPRDTADSI